MTGEGGAQQGGRGQRRGVSRTQTSKRVRIRIRVGVKFLKSKSGCRVRKILFGLARLLTSIGAPQITWVTHLLSLRYIKRQDTEVPR